MFKNQLSFFKRCQ